MKKKLKINNFEVELDCLPKERKTLEAKLNLISLGNGKDLCIITCDNKGCKAAKLIVRDYDNIRRDHYKNGAIEVEVNEPNISLLANNCTGVYHLPKENILHISYKNCELLVRIVYK